MKLSNILYLDEGLLKLPPVLTQKIKQEVYGILAAKYFLVFREELPKLEQELNEVENDSTEFYNLIPEIITNTKKIIANSIKTKKPMFYNIPFEKNISYSNFNKKALIEIKTEMKKISTEGEYLELTVAEYVKGKEPDELMTFYGEEAIFELRHWLEDRYFYNTFNGKKTDLENKIEQLKDILPNFESKADKNFLLSKKTGNDAKTWGYNLTVNLTPDMFEGWLPGNKQLDISKLLYKKKYSGDKLYSPKIYIKVEFKNSRDQKFISSGGEHYSGVYGRMKKFGEEDNTYQLGIVLPYLEPGDNIDYEIRELNNTIEHELGHFVQEILQQIKTGQSQLDYYATGKKRINYGVNSKKLSNKQEQENKTKHELRDIEFYTRLGDVKSELVDRIGFYKNQQEKLDTFKDIVGIAREKRNYYDYYKQKNYWLETLKQENPKKWYKAVKELYKELFPSNPI